MPRMTSDGDLIQRAATGDRSAFEDLYHRYSRPVFGLALRRLGDRGRAEDAVQETFASIWRAARTYKPERGPGGPWLYAVARNAIVDRGRARTEPPVDAPEEASPEAGARRACGRVRDAALPAAAPDRRGARARGRARPRGLPRRLPGRPPRQRKLHDVQIAPDARGGHGSGRLGDDRPRRARQRGQ